MGPLLEVVTRRYYDIRTLEDVTAFERNGRRFVTGNFDLLGERLNLVSAVGEYAELPGALDEIGAVASENPRTSSSTSTCRGPRRPPTRTPCPRTCGRH